METLQNLLQSVQQESQVDQANYKDQFNWCNEAFAEQKSSQQHYNDLIADLSSKLAAEQASGRQLKDAGAEQEQEMAEAKQAAEQAAALRQKEHEDFVGEQQSLMSLASILSKASAILSASPSLDSLRAVAESLVQVTSKQPGVFSAAQKDQLTSFSRSVAGAADAQGLKSEVSAASQTLQDLIAKFQAGVSGAQAKERQAMSEYNGIIRLKQQSLAQLSAAKDTSDARLAESLQKVVQLQRSLRDVQALAAAEASHSQGLQSVCGSKSNRWSVRSRTRVGISERLQQVVAALRSDVLGDTTKVTRPSAQVAQHPVSMMQMPAAISPPVSHQAAAAHKAAAPTVRAKTVAKPAPAHSARAVSHAAPALKTQARTGAGKAAAPTAQAVGQSAKRTSQQQAAQPAAQAAPQPTAQLAAQPAEEPGPLGDVPEVDLGDSPMGASFLQTGEETNLMSLPQGAVDPAAPPMLPVDAGSMQLPEAMVPPQDMSAMGNLQPLDGSAPSMGGMAPPLVPSAVAIPSGALDAPGAMVAPVAMASPDAAAQPVVMASPNGDAPVQLGGAALVQLPATAAPPPTPPSATMTQVVNQLQGQLASGETDEEKHKEWCESESSKNQAALTEKTTKLQHVSTKIESRKGTVVELDRGLQFLARENQTLQVRLARLGQVTQAEAGGEATASQDQRMAEQILKQATTILERFGRAAHAPAAESFLQVASSPQRGQAPHVSAVEGLKEAALRYEQLGQLLGQSKAQAEGDLQRVARSSQDLRGVLSQAKDYQTSLRIELMSGLDSDQEDQASLSSEVDSVKAYVKHLQQACADISGDYDERAAQRKDDIKELQQAGTAITADATSAAGGTSSAKDESAAPGDVEDADTAPAGTVAGESIVSDLQSLQDINSKTAA